MNPEKLIEIAHRGQYRKTGDPYTSHLYAVRDILKNEVGIDDQDLLKAALLHDVLEDTPMTKAYLEFCFGNRVASIVYNLTKVSKWGTAHGKAYASFYQLESNWMNHPEIILIKIADRIHNIRTIDGFRPEKQVRYLKETKEGLIPVFQKVLAKSVVKKYNVQIEMLLQMLEKEVVGAEVNLENKQ